MRRSIWPAMCGILFLAGLLLATPVWADDTIKVGIVDCYSGPPSTYTIDVRDAFIQEVEKVNSQGGVLGKKIEYTTRDSKFQVSTGLSAAKELIMRQDVDILMGTINSALALAISDLAKAEKIPFLATFAKSEKITGSKGHRYVFGMNENTAMAGRAAAVALADMPFTTYWIGGDDYEYGHAIAESVWNHLKEIKPEVELLGQSWWKVGEPDFTPYITSMLSAQPDAAIIATGGADCVPFLKAAKSTGFAQKIPFYMHTATELATLRPLSDQAPEGVLGTSNYFFYYPETKENRDFAQDFQDNYDRYPTVGALYGYTAAKFIIEGLKKAGEVDTEKFIDAVEGMSVASPVGELTLRAFDHQVMFPMFMGQTTRDPEYDFLIAKDIVAIPADQVVPSVQEIREAREE
ncbi:MAG: ABC transporter substrate-binding protein [Desulfovermiculus sp.]|nr:ABC transporter substrate-binding protein [Desulfovermiculus sp.]